MCNLYHVSPKGDAENFIGRAAYQIEMPSFEVTTVGPFDHGVFLHGNGPRQLRARVGRWGMIKPGMSRKQIETQKHLTNNARIETVAELATYRDAWNNGQRCLIPAKWLQEPNWETNKCIWWRLRRADEQPWMIGGIWSEWTDPETGEIYPSYSMLTFNVNSHPLLSRLHRPDVDKKTGQVLPFEAQDKRGEAHIEPADWETWLHGSIDDAKKLLIPPPVEMFDQHDARMTDQRLEGLRAGDLRPEPPPDQTQLF